MTILGAHTHAVLNIEKHVQALDLANQVDIIKEAYLRILPDTVDQTAFFHSKGWDYQRRRAT